MMNCLEVRDLPIWSTSKAVFMLILIRFLRGLTLKMSGSILASFLHQNLGKQNF